MPCLDHAASVSRSGTSLRSWAKLSYESHRLLLGSGCLLLGQLTETMKRSRNNKTSRTLPHVDVIPIFSMSCFFLVSITPGHKICLLGLLLVEVKLANEFVYSFSLQNPRLRLPVPHDKQIHRFRQRNAGNLGRITSC